MATDRLKAALEQVENLSPERQNMIAEQILETIEDQEWDEWFVQPEISQMMDELEEKAKEQHLAGKTKKYIPGKSLAELFQR